MHILNQTVAQVSFFVGDYMNALNSANAFDQQIQNDASKISADYAYIVALSIRQSLASMEITVSQNSDGSFNSSDVLVFMKGTPSCALLHTFRKSYYSSEISSDGVRLPEVSMNTF